MGRGLQRLAIGQLEEKNSLFTNLPAKDDELRVIGI
jgi:hypothetical protein